MQNKLAELDAIEHYAGDVDGAVVHEPSVRVKREHVQALERVLAGMPQQPIEMDHHFALGVYHRSGIIPQGTVCTGDIHLQPSILVLVSGTAAILNGGDPVLVTGPWCEVGPAGVKRAVYAVTDCVFVNLHSTNHTDPEEVRKDLVVRTEAEYQARKELPHVGSDSSGSSRDSYLGGGLGANLPHPGSS